MFYESDVKKNDGWSYLWGGSSWVLRLVFSAISRLFPSRRHHKAKTVVWKFAASAVSKYSLLLLAGLSLPLSREILAAEDELKSAAVAGSKGRSTSTTSRPGCLRKCQFAALFCKLLERQSSRSAPISQAFILSFFSRWMEVNLNGRRARSSFCKGPLRRVNLIHAQIACSTWHSVEIPSDERRVMLDKSPDMCSVTGPQRDTSLSHLDYKDGRRWIVHACPVNDN